MLEKIKILGICGSPIKGGNTETYLKESLRIVEKLEGVESELVTTTGKQINDCNHCNWCMFKASPGKYCAQKDDMTDIYPKILDADAVLFATPVYLSRTSAVISCILDRLRAFAFGKHRGMLKNKVGGSLSVAWYRHGGIETAQLSIYESLFALEFLPVSVHHSGAFYGAGGVSSIGGAAKFDPNDKLQVLKDEWGLKGGRDIVMRMVEVARVMKVGKKVLVKEGYDPNILSISRLAREFHYERGAVLAHEEAARKGIAQYPPIDLE